MRTTLLVVMSAAVLAGCASYYEESADSETLPIVRRLEAAVDEELPAKTPEGVLEPQPEGPKAEFEEPEAAVEVPVEVPEVITLKDALVLAFSTSRDFQFQKESLYLSALSFTFTRHKYSWRPSAVLSGDISIDGRGDSSETTTADAGAVLGLTKRLLSGGSFSISGRASQFGAVGGAATDSNSSSASATFSQPLLAGAGVVGREELVQAERSLLYDARDFELFRQDQVIDILTRYYELLRRRRFIQTARANAEQSTFLHKRSKALFDKGRLNLVDVFRAEQQMLRALNDLNSEKVAYDLALDRFKIALGLSTARNVDVADEKIAPEFVKVDVEEAVKTALANRLDLQTARERLADAERNVLVARNALLPELDLVISADSSSKPGAKFDDYRVDDASAYAGLTLTLPVDKKSERNSYKSALVSLARQRRAYQLAEDNVILNVRDTVRALQQTEFRLVIEQANWDVAKDRLEASQLLLEKGEVSNREVVEAQTELQNAENAYVRAQVDYIIGYIRLLKNMGTLRVDERGSWH